MRASREFLVAAMVVLIASGPAPLMGQTDHELDWSISSGPEMEIGGSPTSEEQQLFEVTDVGRLSDGSVVVANNGTGEIRIYSPGGEWKRSIGGKGEGPGEFSRIERLGALPGDSLYVFDRGAQRLSIFRRDGTFVRDERVTPSAGGPAVQDLFRLADGSWISVEGPPGEPSRADRMRRSVRLLVAREKPGATGHVIAEIPGEIWGRASAGGQTGFRTVLFTPDALYGIGGTCVVAVAGDEATVRAHSATGEVVRDWTVDLQPRSVTDDDVDRYVERAVVENDVPPEGRAQIRQMLEAFPRPDRMPLFSDMVVDELGFIWLQHYAPPLGSSGRWMVLDAERGVLGVATLPTELKIHQIGADWILAEWEGEFDTVRVGLFGLDRTGGPSDLSRPCKPE